jgi:hypothetical protein
MKSISLTRYLIQQQHAGHINADLRLLIEVVARACKTISIAVGKGALGGVLGDAGESGVASMNIQGEAQKKLDVLSNDILLEANAWGGHLAGLASEEMDHSQPIPDAFQRGSVDDWLYRRAGSMPGERLIDLTFVKIRVADHRADRAITRVSHHDRAGIDAG